MASSSTGQPSARSSGWEETTTNRYTTQEDYSIIRRVLKQPNKRQLNGNFWKHVKHGLKKNKIRKENGIRGRFFRYIVPNIDKYASLTSKEKEKVRKRGNTQMRAIPLKWETGELHKESKIQRTEDGRRGRGSRQSLTPSATPSSAAEASQTGSCRKEKAAEETMATSTSGAGKKMRQETLKSDNQDAGRKQEANTTTDTDDKDGIWISIPANRLLTSLMYCDNLNTVSTVTTDDPEDMAMIEAMNAMT